MAALAICLVVATPVCAVPVAGTYDSRDPGSTVLATLWDIIPGENTLLNAYGYADTTQWHIEGEKAGGAGWTANYIEMNSTGPWFGDDPVLVGGYYGDVTDVNCTESWDGSIFSLTVTGEAILNQYHMEPWYDFDLSPMTPVSMSFELGFVGVPFDDGWQLWWPNDLENPQEQEGQYYAKFTIDPVPEPSCIIVLLGGLGSLLAVRRRRA